MHNSPFLFCIRFLGLSHCWFSVWKHSVLGETYSHINYKRVYDLWRFVMCCQIFGISQITFCIVLQNISIKSNLKQQFKRITHMYLSQNSKPISSLLHTDLSFFSHCINPSPVLHVFVARACVRACVRACACVCVCVCATKWAYPYVFVNALGSYEMGRHK